MPTSLALDPRHVLWSAPEPQRAGRPLIVLMHGWSYDERHLFAFAHLFPAQMVVASVRAPYAEAGGYAWFPSRGNPIGSPQPRVANDPAGAVGGGRGRPAEEVIPASRAGQQRPALLRETTASVQFTGRRPRALRRSPALGDSHVHHP